MGIKVKYAAILSGFLILTAASMGAFMVVSQRRSMEQQIRSMAGTITDEFARNSKIPLLESDSLALNQLIQGLLKSGVIEDAYILNDRFEIASHRDLHIVGRIFDRGPALKSLKGGPPWLLSEDSNTLTLVSPVVFKDTRVGYAVVSFSKDFIAERVRSSVKGVLVITVVFVILGGLISIPLAAGFLRPIFMLLRGTEEISKGNLEYRIPEGAGGEVGSLVKSFNHMATELRKKEIIKGVLNRYVSPHVADEILKNPESLDLGGDRREVSVFFADIRDFTRHSAAMRPEEIVDVLNGYFSLVTEIVFRFDGTIDKFIGDEVMCVFGSPVRTSGHLEQAVKAAHAVRAAVERLNVLRRGRSETAFHMGMGLDSGEAIVGNMGSRARMEYTVVGETVNMASRLTAIAGPGEILVDGVLLRLIEGHVEARGLGRSRIKGLDRAVDLYSIVDLKGEWKVEAESAVEEAFKGMGGQGLFT